MKTTDYEKQAQDFLDKTKTSFEAQFLGFKKHFEDDKHERFVFKTTFKRGNREHSFNYGGSIQEVEDYFKKELGKSFLTNFNSRAKNFSYPAKVLHDQDCLKEVKIKADKIKKPSAYDVLACLTKYDPGTFEDFCSTYGYDEDSRTSEKIYKAVCEEWKKVQTLWSDSEIEELAEIQ